MIEDGKTERLEYELVGVPKITGIVWDEKGAPLNGAKLRICPGGRDDAVSDADGKFEVACDLADWPPWETTPVMFIVSRQEEGNLAAAVRIEEETRIVDVVLKPGVIFLGKVTDPKGKGVANARLTVCLRGPGWSWSIGRDQPTTDEQGKFEIKAVPAGQTYSLYTTADGYGDNHSEQIDAADAVNYRLDLGNIALAVANRSVSGVVVDSDDKPIAGAIVSCSGDNQPHHYAQTDTEGRFTLEKVCAGRILINAENAGTPRLDGYAETEGGATGVRIVISQRPSSARYEPKPTPSLIGKPLPGLKELGVDLPPRGTDGKMILICLFDMNQRPSRNCVTQLAKQAEQLKEKCVTIIAVQATKVDETALNKWVKENSIPFPVGMIQADEEKNAFRLGRKIPSLADPD